jgi:hypothetical protein
MDMSLNVFKVIGIVKKKILPCFSQKSPNFKLILFISAFRIVNICIFILSVQLLDIKNRKSFEMRFY